MAWIIAKFGLSAAVVVAASEFAKRSGRLGGLIAALPLTTLLAVIALRLEGQPDARIGQFVESVFWFLLPSLPMFLAFPRLLPRLGFWPALGSCAVLTAACFAVESAVLRRFGVELL
jgi:hypothetical protein